ncbi:MULTISPECIES: flagellar basal body P-ring formation chaperone FlgA [Idiomarina]|jgi:flagella basal body P-ring formation protein FlgA|uniref:flagellar basal body P-ring formation chaperone FlgA n=1 Tax=Idiomarina TaxID=135575 RepID=UPI000A9C70CD|nr:MULTISPECIES: flagellar basal body P-ring formation chaperone FlgA [Idiomarina]MBF39752.1 flagella basal body P-ring formation protein FlgA [Idiomarinaceae bacterium]MTJ01004.1 flagellar basal body P-ring formation protein FlgA [Idiomarina piscisalsi]|tara:strand:- start:35647 stop:36372 length:726 start_codon:yes stop_codon:yes gene_type:complete
MIVRKSLLISSLFAITILLLGFTPNNALAQSNDVRLDYKALQTLAHDFVRSQVSAPESGRIDVVANNLDPRMTAKRCSAAPEVGLASNARLDGYTTVEIKCATANGWRTYVPVRIYRYKNVVTASGPMSPGQMISDSDLTFAEVDLNQIRSNVYTTKELLIGARVKKRIGAGQAIRPSDTCLVCEDQTVTIVAKNKALRITADGKALADGLKGESVVVKNARSGKSIEAVVTGLNEVTVNL